MTDSSLLSDSVSHYQDGNNPAHDLAAPEPGAQTNGHKTLSTEERAALVRNMPAANGEDGATGAPQEPEAATNGHTTLPPDQYQDLIQGQTQPDTAPHGTLDSQPHGPGPQPPKKDTLTPQERRKLLEYGLAALRDGCSLVPTGWNKRPVSRVLPVETDNDGNVVKNKDGTPHQGWKCYQERLPTENELRLWMREPRVVGLAAVCGAVSGGLFVLDYDNPRFFAAWLKEVGTLPEEIVIEQTGGGGYQIAVRCPHPGENAKLAWELDESQGEGRTIAIETRGEGGYALIPHSLHPSGNFYQLLHGSHATIPFVEREMVDRWIEAARSLDEMPLTKGEMMRAPLKDEKKRKTQDKNGSDGKSAIEAFNEKHALTEMLKECGYTEVESRFLRPDASPDSVPGVMLLPDPETGEIRWSYHFSSNDPMDDRHRHDAFDLYCQFKHGGDVKAAVKAAAIELGMYRGRGRPPKNAKDQAKGDTRDTDRLCIQVANRDFDNVVDEALEWLVEANRE